MSQTGEDSILSDRGHVYNNHSVSVFAHYLIIIINIISLSFLSWWRSSMCSDALDTANIKGLNGNITQNQWEAGWRTRGSYPEEEEESFMTHRPTNQHYSVFFRPRHCRSVRFRVIIKMRGLSTYIRTNWSDSFPIPSGTLLQDPPGPSRNLSGPTDIGRECYQHLWTPPDDPSPHPPRQM